MAPKTKRENMHPSMGKILNEDDTTYDFTAGFRALAVAVATLPALLVSAVTRLTSILAAVLRGDIDSATGVFASISYPHHEIHEGNMFHADINTTDLDDEGNNDALHISFITPNTAKWGHLLYKLYASGQATFEIIEAPTGGVAGGSTLAIYNHDRNSSNTSVMKNTNDGTVNQATQDATAPTGGIIVHHEKLGTGKNKQSGEGHDDNEFILKQNTKYSFRMISLAGDITAQLTLEWYEHTNVE